MNGYLEHYEVYVSGGFYKVFNSKPKDKEVETFVKNVYNRDIDFSRKSQDSYIFVLSDDLEVFAITRLVRNYTS